MPINDPKPVQPYLDDINKHDGKLALSLWAALAAGDQNGIASDLAKVRALGLTGDANAIQSWVSSHKLTAVPKNWATLGSELNNAKGLAGAAINSLNPLAGLFQKNLWLRIAEVGLGLLLLTVGVAKLTNAIPLATKIASRLA